MAADRPAHHNNIPNSWLIMVFWSCTILAYSWSMLALCWASISFFHSTRRLSILSPHSLIFAASSSHRCRRFSSRLSSAASNLASSAVNSLQIYRFIPRNRLAPSHSKPFSPTSPALFPTPLPSPSPSSSPSPPVLTCS